MTRKTAKIWHIVPALLQVPIYIFTRAVFTIFAGLKIEGRENVRNVGPAIFASNHVSEWDGPLIRTCLPFFSRDWSPMYFVGLREGGYGKDFGFRRFLYRGEFFKMFGAYPTFPGNKNYKDSLAWFLEILRQDGTICIFPEGKRNLTGIAGKSHGGVSFLSHATGVPVVPVRITGLENPSFFRFLFFRMKVTVTFGSAFDAQTLVPAYNPTVDDYREGADMIMSKVYGL